MAACWTLKPGITFTGDRIIDGSRRGSPQAVEVHPAFATVIHLVGHDLTHGDYICPSIFDVTELGGPVPRAKQPDVR